MTGQDKPTHEVPVMAERFNGDRRADHDHDHRAKRRLLALCFTFHTSMGANHGDPSIGAKAGGVIVAVVDTGLKVVGNHPTWDQVPQVHLLFNTPANRLSRHHTTQSGAWLGQCFPVVLGQAIDVF